MEVHFSEKQEAQLSPLPAHAGKDTEHLVKDVVLRILDDAGRFRGAVEHGISAAERVNLWNTKKVWANVEKILQP